MIFYLFLFFIFLGLSWSIFFEPYRLKVEEVKVGIKNLPSVFEGIKIVQLSDLHSGKMGRREKKVLQMVKKINPDFIFITGDFVDWTTKNINHFRDFFAELSQNGKIKIFGVYGNHDHDNRNFSAFNTFFKENNVEILNNESRKIEKNGEFIHLLGVDDPHRGFDNIEKTMAGLEDNAPKILLAHSPDILRRVQGKNIDLILTGHTHGGQVNIPFLVKLVLPLKYDKKYQQGLFQENGTYLYVNRGIGPTLLPIRFNSPPEVTSITLTRR